VSKINRIKILTGISGEETNFQEYVGKSLGIRNID